jgi:predicted nucleic acid-binding protein
MVLLDTNLVSELARSEPNSAVLAWAMQLPRGSLFTSAVTEAELRLGVALLPQGRRKRELIAALERMFATLLGDRVLPFDRDCAAHYSTFMAERRRLGCPVSTADAQIAAIARARGAALLATRNTADFDGCGVALLNPWQDGS